MLEQASPSLQRGQAVVLDGTFHRQSFRQLVEDLAMTYEYPLLFVEITADEDTIRIRIAC